MVILKSSARINEKNMKRDEFDIYKKQQLSKCYRIINICTGKTPTSFEFNDKKYTPVSFYNKIIIPLINMENFVSISNIPDRHIHKTYVTEYSITVLPELPPNTTTYNFKKMIGTSDFNVDDKTFKSAIAKCIDNHSTPVFIGVNIDHFMIEYNSILDTKSSILSDLFDVEFALSKTEGFKSNTSIANHAMAIVGYNEEQDGNISRWKVENSYGTNGKNRGICLMTKEWFDNYTTLAIVPLDCLHPNLREKAKNRGNPKYVSFWK
jgi:bleomycin hydrolase